MPGLSLDPGRLATRLVFPTPHSPHTGPAAIECLREFKQSVFQLRYVFAAFSTQLAGKAGAMWRNFCVAQMGKCSGDFRGECETQFTSFRSQESQNVPLCWYRPSPS